MRRVLAVATHSALGVAAYTVGYRTGSHDKSDPAREFAEHARQEKQLKTELLDHLMHRAYIKLAPSPIAGVGAFALIDIPAGVDPFAAPNGQLSSREVSVTLTADDLMRCPATVVDHMLDFHDHDQYITKSGRLYPPLVKVNARGMVAMDASWYLNHSEEANVEQDREAGADGSFFPYRTTRHIRAGEELVLDYRKALPGVYAQIRAQRAT